jgi:TRAP-type C4-dicarboxylate transport system permease large subunit
VTDLSIGLLGLAALFILMILRTPVSFAMLLTGFFGIWVLDGANRATAIMFTETYSALSNYNLIVVPMFVLLGNIASESGFSRALYDAANGWVGRFQGGLASASVIGCAAFSAVSGSSVATAVTIGRVALPEMRRFGYAPGLATGAVAAGGTLGFLIPPSTGFVLYAILTEESIGRLFMAGILPGLLMTMLFVVTVWLVTLRDPAAGTRGLVILIAFGTRSLDLRGFTKAVGDTVRTSAMLYMIVVGASVLNPFLAVTDIPLALGEMLAALGLGAYGTLVVILLSYALLGMLLDGLAMLVITIPIYFPVIVGLGFDPVWFGVIAVIMVELGMITPPVGLNVFVVRSVAGDVPLSTIFAGVLPFLAAMIMTLLLIILFPWIALAIPDSMFG